MNRLKSKTSELTRGLGTSPAVRRRKGMAIVITALMLTFMVPIIGLAIDAGVLFQVKAKLQSAVDAASLAAARSLSVGLTLSEQEANANTKATAFFNANFPQGMMQSTTTPPTVSVAETGFRTRTVTVDGSVAAPVYFMRVMGFGTTTVRAIGKASRRDVNVILVVDRSSSLEIADACDDVESASLSFVNMFANLRDRLALVTFGGSYNVDFAPNQTFKTGAGNLVTKLQAIYPGGCQGYTGSAQALWKGYEQVIAINEPGALNVILFFTDGVPNAITADFPVKTQTTTYTPTGKSHCWDWEHNKRYDAVGWNPTTQVYRGFIAGQTGIGQSGVNGYQAGPIPVSGPTAGDPAPVSIPQGYAGSPHAAVDDCYYRTTQSDFEKDIPYYPNTDIYGNSIFGWKSINTFSSGPYVGKARHDQTDNQENAAINAVDNAAQRIRAKELNNSISTVIYSIGLGGTGAASDDLLQRVANDPASTIYDPDSPEGIYVYAPSAAQLNEAFVKIAGEILRIAK